MTQLANNQSLNLNPSQEVDNDSIEGELSGDNESIADLGKFKLYAYASFSLIRELYLS
jgi:hypothetical protein